MRNIGSYDPPPSCQMHLEGVEINLKHHSSWHESLSSNFPWKCEPHRIGNFWCNYLFYCRCNQDWIWVRSWIECRKMYLSVFRAGKESVQFFILNVRDREKSLQDMWKLLVVKSKFYFSLENICTYNLIMTERRIFQNWMFSFLLVFRLKK